jgi:hypothetical protein
MTGSIRALAAIFIVAALVPLATGPAAAQDQRGALRTACSADFRQLCSGVSPGGGRIINCLRDNGDKLTPGCKTALDQAQKPN